MPTPQQPTLQWERVGETGGVGNSCTGSWKGRQKGDSGGPRPEGLSLLAGRRGLIDEKGGSAENPNS